MFNSINTVDVKFSKPDNNFVKSLNVNKNFSSKQKIKQLSRTLEELIAQEKYESAAKVRDLISVYNQNKSK